MFFPRNIFVLVVLGVGLFILHIYLSRRSNKWLGLIVPFLSILFSLFIALSQPFASPEMGNEIYLLTLLSFVIYNIPTAILLIIYLACRDKIKRDKAHKEMDFFDH